MPNWKQLYTNVSIMLDKYQNEIVPDLRAQLVEMNLSRPNVVRCKDCKHYNNRGCCDGFGWCEAWEQGRPHDGYCHCGERRESK